MGQGWTPCVVITRPRYSMSCFLIKYFYGLNLSPAWQAFSKVFNRRVSWCSFLDPCTLASSIRVGILKGIVSAQSNTSWMGCWMQWELSWLCLSSCSVQYPPWHPAWRRTNHPWNCAENPSKKHCSNLTFKETNLAIKDFWEDLL